MAIRGRGLPNPLIYSTIAFPPFTKYEKSCLACDFIFLKRNSVNVLKEKS